MSDDISFAQVTSLSFAALHHVSLACSLDFLLAHLFAACLLAVFVLPSAVVRFLV